ncbi:hypothetical protein LY76DRAFT_671433, partial [Colletotrichum caudatum]
KVLPFAHYIEFHPYSGWDVRRRLVKRFILYCKQFTLPMEIIFLAANYVDRFLSKKTPKHHLRVLGAVAFLLAVEHEGEIHHPPSVFDLDSFYSIYYEQSDIPCIREQLLKMLEDHLRVPSPFYFLRRIATVDGPRPDIHTFARYLAASTVLDERFIGMKPSQVAAASYFLSQILHKSSGSYYNRADIVWVGEKYLAGQSHC